MFLRGIVSKSSKCFLGASFWHVAQTSRNEQNVTQFGTDVTYLKYTTAGHSKEIDKERQNVPSPDSLWTQQAHRKWHCDVSQWNMTQIIQNSQLILVGGTLGQNFLFFGNVFRVFPSQKQHFASCVRVPSKFTSILCSRIFISFFVIIEAAIAKMLSAERSAPPAYLPNPSSLDRRWVLSTALRIVEWDCLPLSTPPVSGVARWPRHHFM